MSAYSKSRRGEQRQGERAQSTAEFVLIVPFLLLFLFLLLDFGWMLKNWIVVTNAAREAARCAVVNSCEFGGAPVSPDQLALKRVEAGLGDMDPEEALVKYLDQDGNGYINAGDTIVVCVKASNHYITPLLGFFSMVTGGGVLPDPMPLKAREQMRLEIQPTTALSVSGDDSCPFSS